MDSLHIPEALYTYVLSECYFVFLVWYAVVQIMEIN